MTVIVGMNNVKIIILTKPVSYLKQEKQSMDSCVITTDDPRCTLNRLAEPTDINWQSIDRP